MLCSFTTVKAQYSTADFYLKKAQPLIDAGEYDKALEKLTEGYNQNPNSKEIVYQIANCYYRLKEYPKAIEYGHRVINRDPENIDVRRLIGNSYDLSGNYEQAINYFQTACARFPYEGEFYFDMGVIEYLRGNHKKALFYWENGIKAEPYFAENYYWAAKTFAKTNEKAYALIYGEIFLNIEKHTDRTKEISILLRDTYLGFFKEKLEGVSVVDLYIDRAADYETNDFHDAFNRVIQQMSINGSFNSSLLNGKLLDNGKTTYLKKIASFREEFIFLWEQMYPDMKMPLFRWLSSAKKGGYLTTYTYWLLMNAEPEFFVEWKTKSVTSFDNFLMWYNRNPLKVNVVNRFSRLDYVKKFVPPPASIEPINTVPVNDSLKVGGQ